MPGQKPSVNTKIKSWAKWAKRCENTLKTISLDESQKALIFQVKSRSDTQPARGLSKRAGLTGLNWAKNGLKRH